LVATWPLGEAAAISGQCESETKGQASLNLTFADYWVHMSFASSGGKASLAGIELFVTVQNGSRFLSPNSTGGLLLTASPKLPLSADTEHFACASELRLPFGQPGGSALVLSATKIQAFGVRNGSLSAKFATCALDARSSVPASPEPPLLNVTVFNSARVPCLRLQLRASLSILYRLKSGGNATVKVALPADTKASGDCGNSSQTVQLSFMQGWRSDLIFVKKASGYALQHLAADYRLSPALFPNAAEPNANRSAFGNGTYFSVASGTAYYSCRSAETLRLDNFVTMETRDLRAQAFRTDNSSAEFAGSMEQCLDDTPIDNVVPIVVGAALAGLVIIVLIAYLIGRRRHSAGSGYQSV
uniref:Lysosome-associated membrane glycoprotein 5 n=1 Tax=Macrostomum lignano TaxID=282301 RepID=A0A1I8GQM5_9PLAT